MILTSSDYTVPNQVSSSDFRKTNIIGWLLLVFFSLFAVISKSKDKFESAEDDQMFWDILSIVYKNICSLVTTFGGLCILYAWYNSATEYNPIPSSLQEEQINQLNIQLQNNQEILSLKDTNNLGIKEDLSDISSLYKKIQKLQTINSLDSCFFISNTNIRLAEDSSSSIKDILAKYSSQSNIQDQSIASIYQSAVLNQVIYNSLNQSYQNAEKWDYKSNLLSKMTDLIYNAQTSFFQLSVKPTALNKIIYHASKPISISQSGSSVLTSFKDIISTSRTASSRNAIMISRSLSGSSLSFLWNSLYPLSLYNVKASQGYLCKSSSSSVTSVLLQDILSYTSPLLESDFKDNNFTRQITLKDSTGLTIYNSLDINSIYTYSDQNSLVILENRGFVPAILTFYYISMNRLVEERYVTPQFTDSSLSNTIISFSLQSKTFYNYSSLPKENGNAYLSNYNFKIYFNSQLNQISYLSLINNKPFTLVKAPLNVEGLACSITYPNPSNTSYPYQTRRYQLSSGSLFSSSVNVSDVSNILFTTI